MEQDTRWLPGLALVAALLLALFFLLGGRDAHGFGDEEAGGPTAVSEALPEGRNSEAAVRVESVVPAERERTAEAEGAERVAAFLVKVSDDVGHPLVGCRVLMLGSDERARGIPLALLDMAGGPPSAETDQEGYASFESLPPKGTFVVALIDGQRPRVRVPSEDEVLLEIVVPSTASLTGHVTVDGRTPAVPVVFRVTSEGDAGLPRGVDAMWLAEFLQRDLQGAEVVSRDGFLEVYGHAPGVSLRVEAEAERFRHQGGPPVWKLPAGTLGVPFELESVPVLSVLLERGDAAVRVEGELELVCERLDGTHEVRTNLRGYVGSVAEIPITAETTRVALSVRQGALTLARAVWTTPLPPQATLQVPEAAAALEFLVTDLAGQALAGARALSDGREFGPSPADGRLEVFVNETASKVFVGAPGYETLALDLWDSTPLPKALRLSKANGLRVRWEGEGARPEQLRVHLRLEPGVVDAGAAFRGGSPASEFASDGVWRADDLPTETRLELELSDRHHFSLGRQTVRLARGEMRELTFALAVEERRIEGRVVDPAGRGVRARLCLVDPWFSTLETDAEGWFTVEDVLGERPKVVFRASGYVPLEVAGEAVFQTHEFVLEPARELQVSVTAAPGADLPESLVFELADGRRFRARKLDPGLFAFKDLPEREGVLRAGDGRAERPVGAAERELRWELP